MQVRVEVRVEVRVHVSYLCGIPTPAPTFDPSTSEPPTSDPSTSEFLPTI